MPFWANFRFIFFHMALRLTMGRFVAGHMSWILLGLQGAFAGSNSIESIVIFIYLFIYFDWHVTYLSLWGVERREY